jgi:hypothetical protein
MEVSYSYCSFYNSHLQNSRRSDCMDIPVGRAISDTLTERGYFHPASTNPSARAIFPAPCNRMAEGREDLILLF